MDKLLNPQLGQLCVISEDEYNEMAKKKVYGIPTYVTLKNGYAYVYPLPANVMDLERENERLKIACTLDSCLLGEKTINGSCVRTYKVRCKKCNEQWEENVSYPNKHNDTPYFGMPLPEQSLESIKYQLPTQDPDDGL